MGASLNNFLQIASQIDVLPILLALHRQPDLWDVHPYRRVHPASVHREASDILLRCEKPEPDWPKRDCVAYPAWYALPQVRAHVFALMARVEGLRLGRVLITRLMPGAQIFPHTDIGTEHGLYYDDAPYYTRYHTLLACPPDALFHCGEESVYMPPGSCWTFRNDLEHAVTNDGDSERISLIVDVHSEPWPLSHSGG